MKNNYLKISFFTFLLVLPVIISAQDITTSDCEVPETFMIGDYHISDVSTMISNFTVFQTSKVTITSEGNKRFFRADAFPTLGSGRVIDVELNLNCGFFQLEEINPSFSCNSSQSPYLLTSTNESDSSTYSLGNADSSFLINYIEDPLASCIGPHLSTFSLTKANCSKPQKIHFTEATANSVKINWLDTNNSSNSNNSYTLEYGLKGFDLGTGEIISGISSSSTTITGLQTNTEYEFYLFASCIGGAESDIVGPYQYSNYTNSKFSLAEDGQTCLCPDADFGEIGTLEINSKIKTFTKRSENELRSLISNDQNDPQISLTCTSGISNMSDLFNGKNSFNESLVHWDVSQVTDMRFLFKNAHSFNQPIQGWNVSQVTQMEGIFHGALNFDQNINNWNVSEVTNMKSAFQNATQFNQPLDAWDVSNVSNMSSLFKDALSFNQDITSWCVEQIQEIPEDFAVNSALQNDFIPEWGVECETLSLINENNIDLNFYPNPVQSKLNLVWPRNLKDKEVQLYIYSLSGKLYFNQTYLHKPNQLDFSSFPTGMYILRLKVNNQSFEKKIVKP